MKIKEVSQKTNLTERAIRLYIENGLVAPSCSESYQGRRNIDFSGEDVDILKNICTLRKAGFSIAEIKQIQQDPTCSIEILKNIIDKINVRIVSDTEILACLTPLLCEEKLDIEGICRVLNNPAIDDKALPTEDSEISLPLKIMRKAFLTFGICSFIFSVICCVPILIVEIKDFISYLYPVYPVDAIHFIAAFVASLVIPLILIIIFNKKHFEAKKAIKNRVVVSAVLLVLFVPSIVFTAAWGFVSGMSHPESLLISQTHNIDNYMKFDAEDAKKAMCEFLPENLPDIKGIKYEYYYKNYGVFHEPPLTEIFLELPLNAESFEETVNYYKSFRPSDSVCDAEEETNGNWKIIFYRQEHEHAPSNYSPLFAYNETTKTVRFICEYGRVSMKGALKPHALMSGYVW